MQYRRGKDSKVAKMLFEQLGCEVDCAEDGDKAVERALANHYDGVCMDIGLITVSGVEACKAIRAYESQNHLKQVPIIGLTANHSSEEIAEYFEVGMQEVLSKPLTKEKAERFLSMVSDRMKAVLLYAQNWELDKIGQFLRVHPATIMRYLEVFFGDSIVLSSLC